MLGPALHHAGRAIALRPDRTRAHATYGQALVKAGDPAAAVPYFERFLRETPTSPDVSALGLALLMVGRTEESVAALARGVARTPDNAMVRVNYAAALVAANRREDALREFRWVLAREPLLPAVRYGFGSAMVRVGDIDAARREHAVLKVLDARLATMLAREIDAAARNRT
jgi:predicted Zn-dependent protease